MRIAFDKCITRVEQLNNSNVPPTLKQQEPQKVETGYKWSFKKDLGHLHVDLINCQNQKQLSDVKMEEFWKGFVDLQSGIKCKKNKQPLILELKNWPASDDFKQLVPTRFYHLMKNPPIREYSHRDGSFNMTSNLPDYFSTPDLGPKIYIAYSSIDTLKDGTTNLHVDISDAVNLLIHVRIQ
jgi:lysine-specific demethylase 3